MSFLAKPIDVCVSKQIAAWGQKYIVLKVTVLTTSLGIAYHGSRPHAVT